MTVSTVASASRAEDDQGEVARGCFVYAVVRAGMPEARDAPAGLDDVPLRLVVEGDVAAVVNDVLLDRPPGRRADLMAYQRVLDHLAAQGPVVPVQFGSMLLDDDDVRDGVLGPDEPRLVALLDDLEGRSQYQLRATYVPGVPLTEILSLDPTVAALREQTKDRSELESHADRVELGRRVAAAMEDLRAFDADVLLDAVLPFVVDHVVVLGTDLEGLATFSLLVDDERVAELEAHLEELAEAVHERIRLALTGPSAPFDFVGGA